MTRADDLAYPIVFPDRDEALLREAGLTKREYFAAAAFAALVSADEVAIPAAATLAVGAADALIAALNVEVKP